MFKIKLLILLQVSFYFFYGCTNSNIESKYKYSTGYIGGELDGLILSNKLNSYLKMNGYYNEESNLKLRSSISHSKDLFITNIDNTSDREEIETSISIAIYDEILECEVYKFSKTISQFYIITSSEYFDSNAFAQSEIKEQNTEELVKLFMDEIFFLEGVKFSC